MKRDYYEVLGVNRSANSDEIKRAYRKLAMQYHPDRNPGNAEAEERFKEAAEAYEVLGNEDKKRRYDQFGHDGLRGQDFGGFSDINDIFSHFSDIFGGSFGGSIFEEVFGGGRSRSHRYQRGTPGSDLKLQLALTLEEIAHGVEKTIKVKKHIQCDTCSGTGAKPGSKPTTCPSCNGTGELRQVSRSVFGQFVNIATCAMCGGEGSITKDPCPTCGGDGRIQGEKTLKVNVPAGVSEGNYIPLRGQGDAGRKGGPAGDIIIYIKELEHEQFVRENNDVLMDLYISFMEAINGTEVEVPTLTGSAKLKVPAGVNAGQILRMRDKGIPELNGRGRGDQLVRVNIFIPTKLSSEEKDVLKSMEKLSGFYPTGKESKKGFFGRVFDSFS